MEMIEEVFTFVYLMTPILCGLLTLVLLTQAIYNFLCGYARNEIGLETTD